MSYNFLWVPGQKEMKKIDSAAKSTSNFLRPHSVKKVLYSDIILHWHNAVSTVWQLQ